MQQNEEWCRSTAASYLAKKNKTWDRYKEEWLFCEAPYAIDLLGLVIWARCYHLQVAVFYEYSFWTTQHVQDLNKCNLFLLYRGNNIFDDSRLIRAAEYKERQREINRTNRKIQHYLQKLKDQKETSSESEEEEQSPSSSDKDKNVSDENLDLEQVLEDGDTEKEESNV